VNFKPQVEAIASASALIPLLPEYAVWSLTVTEDDDAMSPSVLNIYADPWEWPMLVRHLKLGSVVDQGEMYASYQNKTLVISLIKKEFLS